MKHTFLSNPQLKRNPYAVPDGYFDSLPSRILSSLPEQPQADSTAPVITPLHRRKAWKPWVALAAAACVACAIFLTRPGTPTSATSATYMAESTATETYDDEYREAALQYALVDDQAIYNYLAGNY